MAPSGVDFDTESDHSSEASVRYVAGNCLELAGQLSVLKRKRAAKGFDAFGWDGPYDVFEEALDAAMDALEGLHEEVTSIYVEPPTAASSELPTGGEVRTVNVTLASGDSLDISIGSQELVSDLKSRVASQCTVWPCQVLLLNKLETLLDHEALPTSMDSFTAVVRDIVAEAKAIAEELAYSIRVIKQQVKATPIMASAERLYALAAGSLLQAALLDADFGMWAARILDGLSWDELSEIKFYDGFDRSSKKKKKRKDHTSSSPPILLFGRALTASDGGVAAAALFVSLCDGERWCAGTMGQALKGSSENGPTHGDPGEGSSLACAFRYAVEKGCESAARDVLEASLAAAEVDKDCCAPVALAGMARAAAFACKQRSELEVRILAGALITSLLDSLWPGRGCELSGNETATQVLVDDMVSSGLATYNAEGHPSIIAEAAGLLTREAIAERFGQNQATFTLQDLVLDYKHSPGSSDRPLAWDV